MRNQVREVRCNSCGALNRVPSYSIHHIPWCGKCGAALPEHQVVKATRLSYRLGRLSLYYLLLGAFLTAFIGLLTLSSHLMSRQTQLAKNPPSCTAPLPPHGLYRRYTELPLLSRLTLKTETGENYFVKLVDVTAQMSKMDFFLHGGTILSADVPVGTFTVKIRRWARMVWRR
jgi:hypothetical protein